MSFTIKVAVIPLTAGLLALCQCLSVEAGTRNDDTEKLTRTAILGYAANVHAFPFYTCRYRHTKGQANSAREATQGKFINAVSYEAKQIVDGDRELFEGLAEPVPLDPSRAVRAPNNRGAMIPHFVDSNRYLADGDRELNYVPQMRSGGLWSRDKGVRGLSHTPLSMGFLGHRNKNGPDRLMLQPDRYEMHSEGMEEVDGRPTVVVRFTDKKYVGYARRFFFDVERGYLPIRMEALEDGKRVMMQVLITHARECSNERWFPERTVSIHIPDTGGLYGVGEIQVLELDADRRPASSDFMITVPAGTVMSDQSDLRRNFKLKQDERIGLDELPKLFLMLDQVSVQPLMDTAINRDGSSRWLRWLGLAAGVVLLVGGVVVLVRGRLRRAH